MDPDIVNPLFDRYGDVTILNPIAFFLTLAMGLTLLAVQSRQAVFPLIVVACFITSYQRIAVSGIDFDMLRILILFGMVRVLARGEFGRLRLNGTDGLFFVWITWRTIAYSLMRGDSAGMVYALGYAFTAVGLYLLLRISIRDLDDIRQALRFFALVSIPLALAMANEQLTRTNVFSIFGGVPAQTFIREGRLRSQGAFSHPILAGSFGAFLLPLMWGLFMGDRRSRLLAAIGAAAATAITLTSASSGPILAYAAGLGGIYLWRWRRRVRALLWIGVAGYILLDLAMRAPVWALVLRVGVVGGSKGWHRYFLIDQAIKRFGEWWLVGTPSTAHWGFGLFDVTNRYVREGVDGGFLALALFVAIMVVSLATVVRASKTQALPRREQLLVWSLGVSMLTHMVSFISVSYFGQMMFFWYLPVAMIASVRDRLPELQAEQAARERVRPFRQVSGPGRPGAEEGLADGRP
jgi:hypothetical protein